MPLLLLLLLLLLLWWQAIVQASRISARCESSCWLIYNWHQLNYRLSVPRFCLAVVLAMRHTILNDALRSLRSWLVAILAVQRSGIQRRLTHQRSCSTLGPVIVGSVTAFGRQTTSTSSQLSLYTPSAASASTHPRQYLVNRGRNVLYHPDVW